MNGRNLIRSCRGLSAIEVVVSTLLASLLMVALIGVLRGLKLQESALKARIPSPNWKSTLNTVLEQDLANSRTYRRTPTALVLQGFAGRDPRSGFATWQPTTVHYEIVQDGYRSWLMRRESQSHELVLADVTSIRTGVFSDKDSMALPQQTTSLAETPITSGLVVEFWGPSNKEPIYGYRFRRP